MRIQETDRILKESRDARHSVRAAHAGHDGLVTRVWKMFTALPSRFMGKGRHD
jgi:hypothetical protein